jgi:glucose/mannose transport system permease protein
MNNTKAITTKKIILMIILLILALIFIVPFYVTLITSFKSLEDISITQMWDFPKSFSLEGFVEAFKKLSPNLLNSLYLTIPATIISAFIGCLYLIKVFFFH